MYFLKKQTINTVSNFDYTHITSNETIEGLQIRDFNLFKHKDNDPRGFFGLFRDADKRNLKFAAKKISKSVIKKDK